MTKIEYQMTKGASGFPFVIGASVLVIPWSLVGHWWVIRHSTKGHAEPSR
jgi:hypothetical protein